MANPRQLKRLKKDVNAWNEWRKENRKVKINLRGANLSGQDLSKANLSEADIQGANFDNATLVGTDFSKAQTGLQRRWSIALVLFYSLLWLILLCLTIFVLVGIPIGIIAEAKIILSEEGLLLGTIAFAVSLVGTIISGSAVKLITQGESKPKESILVVLIFLAIYTIIFVPSLFIAELQEVIETPKAIEGTAGIVFIWILIASAWYVQKEKKILKDNWISSLAIALVRIKDTSFRGAKLKNAIFSKAILKGADFREADLSGVVWLKTKFFERVRPGDSYLRYPQVRQLVRTGSTQNQQPFKNKNLRGINLEDAILTETSFAGADLSNANLQNADLSRANFFETELKGVNITGATIEDCNINSNPNLDSVICDYVYLKQGQQERRPAHGKFKSGEFAKLIEISRATVDLVFSDGIDWKAFLLSFQELLEEYGEQNVSIQGIQKKSGGAFVISLDVSSTINEKEIESKAYQFYETQIKFLEERLKDRYEQLEDYKEELRARRQENTDLRKIVSTMADQNPSKYDLRGAKVGSIVDTAQDGSYQEINQFNYSSEQEQILAQALADIQKLLKQFEKNNPDATEEEKIIYLNDNTTPSFKRRVIGALQAAGETAIEEFLDNSYVNIGKATIKAWLKPE